jgi:hypothetical protein
VQRAETGTPREQITLTVDEDALTATAGLAHRMRDLGIAVAQQTFVPMGVEEERRVVLLITLHRPLDEVAEWVTSLVFRAPDGVWPALVSTLQALGKNRRPAVLQIKAEDAFVSLVAQDLSDLEQAARLLAPVAVSVSSSAACEPHGVTECRLVYSDGSWSVYGLGSYDVVTYNVADGRLWPVSGT